MDRFRTAFTALAVAAASLVAGPMAQAQPAYPTRSVQLVIAYGAGSVGDVSMRLLADKLSTRFGKPVVIDNRPGAGGIVAVRAAASAAADGYTLLLNGNSYAISTAMFKSLPYDIVKDFDSVSTVAFFDMLIITRSGSALKSMRDVIAHAKANPGKLNIATLAPGSTQSLAAEQLKSITGIQATIVPFRTSPDMATAVLRGNVDIALEFFAPMQSLIQEKKVTVLASAGAKRAQYLPDVPTAVESGIDNFEVSSWNAISVPAGTPKPVIDTLSKAINEVLASPEVQETARKLGIGMQGSTPDEMSARMSADIRRWSEVIEKAGIPKRY